MDYGLLFSTFPNLGDGTLTIRQIQPEDASALFAIHSDEQMLTHCPGLVKKAPQTVANMTGHCARDFGKRKTIICGIYERDALVGLAEMFDADPRVDMITEGYRVVRSHWGQGIATRATALMLEYLFRIIQVNRAQAFVMPENAASLRVLEKNGFTREGLIRQGQHWTGKGVVDLVLFSKLRAEHMA